MLSSPDISISDCQLAVIRISEHQDKNAFDLSQGKSLDEGLILF